MDNFTQKEKRYGSISVTEREKGTEHFLGIDEPLMARIHSDTRERLVQKAGKDLHIKLRIGKDAIKISDIFLSKKDDYFELKVHLPNGIISKHKIKVQK